MSSSSVKVRSVPLLGAGSRGVVDGAADCLANFGMEAGPRDRLARGTAMPPTMQSVPVPVMAVPRSALARFEVAAVLAWATMEIASTRAPSVSGTETCTSVLIVPAWGACALRDPTRSPFERPTVVRQAASTAPARRRQR